jgi:hypothetical protein
MDRGQLWFVVQFYGGIGHARIDVADVVRIEVDARCELSADSSRFRFGGKALQLCVPVAFIVG